MEDTNKPDVVCEYNYTLMPTHYKVVDNEIVEFNEDNDNQQFKSLSEIALELNRKEFDRMNLQESNGKLYDQLENLNVPKSEADVSLSLNENMDVKSETGYYNSEMFKNFAERCYFLESHVIYVVFTAGSVILDVDNANNYIIFHPEYIEIYNDENGETTFIKNDEIKGFVFEEKPLPLDDELDDDEDHHH